MRRLLAASVAAPALILAATAWAQPYPETYPQDSYDQGYDQGYDADDGDYGDYGQPPRSDDSQPYSGQGGPYAMDPDDAYGSSDDEDYPTYPGGSYDQGAPQYPPYESVPPSPRGYSSMRPTYPSRDYSSRAPQATTPMEPEYATAVPADLLDREDRLEQRIRAGGERRVVPSFHVDNLMVQLDSIRAQQEELAARDGGLSHTTRTFIESRLVRLERNVTW